MNKSRYILIIIIAVLSSCNNNPNQNRKATSSINDNIRHAKLFSIEKKDSYKLLTSYDSNKEKLAQIVIPNKNTSIQELPKDVDLILNKPIKSIAILSSTHIGYIAALGLQNLINGCSNPERICDSLLYQKYLKGKITDIGKDMSYNVEKIIELKPDIIFHTGYQYDIKTKKILKKAGIPFISVCEWKETSTLGRAEWLKFFGILLNKEKASDSIFDNIENNYNRLKELAKTAEYKPKLLYGSNFKGTWYMPGGKSYIAQILSDAGANYYYKENNSARSLHLSIENVIEAMQDADFWFSANGNSLDELLSSNKHYSVFKAFKEQKVYNYNAKKNPNGYNNYWETSVVHPDIVLSDIIHILHPKLLKDYKLYYYRKLPRSSSEKEPKFD